MKKLMLVLVLMLVAVCNCAMTVKVLNVGQGDATLIQTGERAVLIDTGDAGEREKLERELAAAGCERLDALILTHGHADHIGNAAWLVRNYGVRVVYDNGKAVASRYYASYMKALVEEGATRKALAAGDVLDMGDGATFSVLASGEGERSVNDDSVCGRLELGGFGMMFTGDASAELEEQIYERSGDLRSVVLKAGHHGSRTSSGLEFVEAVGPEYVIISAGTRYGHPHAAALENYLIAGVDKANIYWTNKNGTVTIDTDGTVTTVTPELVDVWVDEYLGYRIVLRRIG